MKRILALILALLMVFGMVACSEDGGSGKSGKLDTQEMGEDFAKYLFTPDVERLYDMMPLDLAMEQLGSDEREEAEALIDEQIDSTQSMLEAQYNGVDFEWSVDVTDEEELDADELEELNEFYADADLTVDEAVSAETEITLTADGEEETLPLDLVYVKIDGDWYLDVNCIAELANLGL